MIYKNSVNKPLKTDNFDSSIKSFTFLWSTNYIQIYIVNVVLWYTITLNNEN